MSFCNFVFVMATIVLLSIRGFRLVGFFNFNANSADAAVSCHGDWVYIRDSMLVNKKLL